MNPERWKRVKEILAKVQGLDADSRDKALQEACVDDPELSREVKDLLAVDPAEVPALNRPPIRLLDDPEKELKAEDEIGAYRIVRPLGRGGMGVVYLAKRADDEFERLVAIKVLQAGGENEDLVRRFRQEMGILAKLNHPNIAQLHEGGRTEDGRLYYQMEYIEGECLDVYYEREQLGLKGRLRLFQKVCRAVHYAHQNLVVHRDLKPGNILVTQTGTLKLLDFGVAKLLETSPGAPETRTADSQRFFTPEYASPEQLGGATIGTPSDVYSLGVLLYQLLSGTRPFLVRGHSAQEFQGLVISTKLLPPSQAEAVEGKHGNTGETFSNWKRQLRGDLDKIVLMALRKEPGRRYSSAEQLAEDIQRYLDGAPVRAQEDTWGYRTGKFLKRHPRKIAATLLVVLLSLGAALVMAHQQTTITQERDRAESVSEFLVSLFRLSDPATNRGRAIPARELLDRASSQLLKDAARNPHVRAALADTIGTVYLNLGLPAESLPLKELALNLGLDLYSQNDPRVGEALNNLAKAKQEAGDYPTARDLYSRASAVLTSSLPAGDPRIATSYNNLGTLELATGNLDEAETLLRNALNLRLSYTPLDARAVIESQNNLGALLINQGSYSDAETFFREALQRSHRELGEDHPTTSSMLNNIGWSLALQGRLEESASSYLKSLDTRTVVLGRVHSDVAGTLLNLASIYLDLDNFDDARDAAREAVDIYKQTIGLEHQHTAHALHNLAKAHFFLRDLEEAERIGRECIRVRENVLPDNHPETAYGLSLLAEILESRRKFQESESLHRRSLGIRQEAWSGKHPSLWRGYEKLGLFLSNQGRQGEAEPLIQKALEIALETEPEESTNIAGLKSYLASFMCRRPSERGNGEQLAREALEVFRRSYSNEHARVGETKMVLGLCLTQRSAFEEADRILRQAYGTIFRIRGRESERTEVARRLLRELYSHWGRSDELEDILAHPENPQK